MTIKRLTKELEKFNEELQKYYNETGDTTLPEVDSSIIGDETEVEPYNYKVFGYGLRVQADGWTWKVKECKVEDESWLTDWETSDGLKWDLQEKRRMLKKAWRIWRSENPDAELEKEDEE